MANSSAVHDAINLTDAALAGSSTERRAPAARIDRVALTPGDILLQSGQPIEHIYIVERGLVALRAGDNAGRPFEIAVVGPGGIVGIDAILAVGRAGHQAVVEIAGTACRMAPADFISTMRRNASLMDRAKASIGDALDQFAEAAIANASGTIRQRLARWLLMRCDQLKTSELEFTHEHAADALGVRRPGVTVALHEMEGEHCLKSSRGHCVIRDRAALVAAAAPFYGTSAPARGAASAMPEAPAAAHPAI